MYLFLRTIYDVGFKKIFIRLIYEIRKKIDILIGPKLSMLFCIYSKTKPTWKENIENLYVSQENPFRKKNSLNYVKFKFINEEKKLFFPINWNKNEWPRLWQFNLHYFDWIKQSIDIYLETKDIDDNFCNIEKILDEWILFNKPGVGDGWHSYTISQRVRNWIWLFRIFPTLLNKKRIKSLWEQILWLESHPEECYGGNHWLENLIALCFSTLQFEGQSAEIIFNESFLKLEKELNKQILRDGGHEERSASYHILILDKLVELGCILQIIKSKRPTWLVNHIQKMTVWLERILLEKNNFPRFNDSPMDACPSPKIVLFFAISYLKEIQYKNKGLRFLLISAIKKNVSDINLTFKNEDILDFPETGWTILRPGNGWELTFKNGIPCPKNLPAHVHSDLLSFDLFYKGVPVIAEAGTSIYQDGVMRNLERSAKSHNLLQLAPYSINDDKKGIMWIEPVEIWGSFRAARKANPTFRLAKKLKNKTYLISGSNDTHKRFGAFHQRTIKLMKDKSENLKIEFIDHIICQKRMWVRQSWHIGPSYDKSLLEDLVSQSENKFKFENHWEKTMYAIGFGKRVQRRSLFIKGILDPGEHIIKYDLIIKAKL